MKFWTKEVEVETVTREEFDGLKAELAELRRALVPEEPTVAGLPTRIRAAIDAAIDPFAQDRTSQRVRSRLLRGARARLKAGWTDAGVAQWIEEEGS
jgi:hypothetical protein